MFWLFRRFCTVLGFLVLVLLGCYFARDWIVSWTLCWSVTHSTTFGCSIRHLHVESVSPVRIVVQGMTIENPPDFDESLAIDIPEAQLTLEPGSSLSKGLIFSNVEATIAKLNVVQSEPGISNLNRFYTIAKRNEGSPSYFEFLTLKLRIIDPRYARVRQYSFIDSQRKIALLLFELVAKK